jgi:hypothetical protein
MLARVKSLLARPFVHQAVDYGIGFAVASAAVRSQDRTALVIAAVVVLASTAMFAGPLAAFRVFPHTAHLARGCRCRGGGHRFVRDLHEGRARAGRDRTRVHVGTLLAWHSRDPHLISTSF